MKAIYLLGADPYSWIYGEPERQRIAQLVDIYAPPQTPDSVAENPAVLAEAEVFLSGWGCPKLTAELLDAAPNLKLVLYGAGPIKTFWYVTVPQLKPMILLTAIMSTNGTIQLFDESWNLTQGGPAYTSMTMSHYLFELSFLKNPNFGYGAALSYVILILVAVLAFIQMKIGDKRD